MSDQIESNSVLWVDRLSVEISGRVILDQISFSLNPGELLAVVGPSGSGKSSLLNAIAGFLAPSDGQIVLGGDKISEPGFVLPPEKRGIGMVFQSHALWQQMTVRENVAFPLRRQGTKKKQALQLAEETLNAIGIAEYSHRFPEQLSGGQQQRVGLARALAASPRLFLFDEPTANLDPLNRQKFADEVRRRQRAAGVAAVYVTHHIQEAFEIADRVLVLIDGRMQQIGTPSTIYEFPASPDVASLCGKYTSFQGTVLTARSDDLYVVLVAGQKLPVTIRSANPLLNQQSVQLMCRPEWCKAHYGLSGIIRTIRYHGMTTEYELETPIGKAFLSEMGPPRYTVEQPVGWAPQEATVMET